MIEGNIEMTQAEQLQNGVGRTLKFLGRAAAMVSITLQSQAKDEPDYQIHIDTATSILLHGTSYTSTAEIDDSQPYGICEFDKKATAIVAAKESFRLERIFYDASNLLHLFFSNGLEIHACTVTEHSEEMWRVFLDWTADIHLIGYPEGIVEEPPLQAQPELDEQKRIILDKLRQKRKQVTAY